GRLRQILINLIGNGVKFTHCGEVKVKVARSAAHPRTPGALEFTVRDSGIGMDSASCARIFNPFTQADSSTTRRFGGTGLGLAICRELVQLMGGTMRVESEPGRGSVFAFELPLERVSAAANQAAPEAAGDRPLRILAAEDNHTNQLILAALLAPIEAELTMVGNGREAVEAFDRTPFDLVLMDIQMPEMSGVDATHAIRRAERKRGLPRTPILAVSANVMSHQIDEYLAAGMDAVVAKPVQAAVLFAEMQKALSTHDGAPTVARAVG
ncbi:MAG TPA: ATP-binding protein, partial [Arenibaculum sp.]|nr:ATP-binding protein [Arenibaculum sp.]